MKQDRDERDLLDILFASRNRAYGAYQLRRNYPDAMRRALFLGLTGPVLLLFLGSWMSKRDFEKVKTELSAPKTFEKPPVFEEPKIKLEPIRQPELPEIRTQRFVPPLPVPDEKVIEEAKIADVKDLENAQISTKTRDGEASENAPIDEIPDVLEKGPTEKVKPTAPPEPFIFVEKMPTFPGGERELLTFFSKNMVYPNLARETGIEGRVIVQFTVETDGSITDVRIAKSPSKLLSDEAERVARLMPRWSAGEQNGRLVRVRCSVPVVFDLN